MDLLLQASHSHPKMKILSLFTDPHAVPILVYVLCMYFFCRKLDISKNADHKQTVLVTVDLNTETFCKVSSLMFQVRK